MHVDDVERRAVEDPGDAPRGERVETEARLGAADRDAAAAAERDFAVGERRRCRSVDGDGVAALAQRTRLRADLCADASVGREVVGREKSDVQRCAHRPYVFAFLSKSITSSSDV